MLGETIDPSLNARVHALAAALDGNAGIVDLAPAYASLLVIYDPATLNYPGVRARVYAALADSPRRICRSTGALASLPVAYGGEYGPDLSSVAERLSLSEAETVRLHTSTDYRVYMIGFAPGYSYLGELPSQLEVPRLSTPREHVPARLGRHRRPARRASTPWPRRAAGTCSAARRYSCSIPGAIPPATSRATTCASCPLRPRSSSVRQPWRSAYHHTRT